MAAVYSAILDRASFYYGEGLARYRRMGFYGKAAVWVWAALHVVVGLAVWIITPARLFEWMANGAETIRDLQSGWALLLGLIILTSIPPLFGYGTCITLCGFAFGPLRGWLLAMSGCLMGSVVSFLLVRRMLNVFAPLHSQDKTFKALARAVRAKGLVLVVLIRLCPFPFPYSNAFFASIESVGLLHFLIATLAITPKLFLHVWVGSKMFMFADPESRNSMDSRTKMINIVYVVFATLLGMGTSYYLYRLTMQYVNEVALEEADDLEAGLIRTIDGFLDAEPASEGEEGEDEERDEHEHDILGEGEAQTTPLIPQGQTKRPSIGTHTQSAPQPPTTTPTTTARKSIDGRPSEDRWEGAFSDFDDPVEEEERDEWGLGLAEIIPPTRPSMNTRMSSTKTLVEIDKRSD